MGFTYFYTAFTFKPDETADQLRKNGGFIPGIRPGAPTRDYLQKVVFRLSLAGAIFLATIAVSPIILSSHLPRRRCRRIRAWRHGLADRRLGRGRDDEADRGAADDAQLRGLHSLKVYVMLGGPGAGKGTQAALLAERLGYAPRRIGRPLPRSHQARHGSGQEGQEVHRCGRAGS